MDGEEYEAHEKLVKQNVTLEQEVADLKEKLEVKTKMLDKYVNLLIRVIEKFV